MISKRKVFIILNFDNTFYLDGWPGHLSIGDHYWPLDTIGHYAMWSIAVGKVEWTFVAGLAHHKIRFNNKFITTNSWRLVDLALTSTRMLRPVVHVRFLDFQISKVTFQKRLGQKNFQRIFALTSNNLLNQHQLSCKNWPIIFSLHCSKFFFHFVHQKCIQPERF